MQLYVGFTMSIQWFPFHQSSFHVSGTFKWFWWNFIQRLDNMCKWDWIKQVWMIAKEDLSNLEVCNLTSLFLPRPDGNSGFERGYNISSLFLYLLFFSNSANIYNFVVFFFSEEVKRLCASHFNSIFFLD